MNSFAATRQSFLTGGRALLAVVLLVVPCAADETKPRRLASLNLAADEILAELVPVERLVAVTFAADDPASSNVLGRFPERIPRFFKADLARLVALQPDLVVVSEYTDADFMRLLSESGLSHHRMAGLDSLEGFRAAILDLGEAVGERASAQRLVAEYDARLSALAARLVGAERPRVLYWVNPYTVGADTAIGALIECGGGRNVGAELGLTGLVPLGAERAFVAAPEVLLVGRVPDGTPPVHDHPLLSQLPAVREGRVVALPTSLLATLSQHAAVACERLAAALHPEQFPLPPVARP